jgi:uncharacterized protein
MRPTALWAVLAVAFCFAVAASAGEPITVGERLTLQSKVLNEERTILVSTPHGYEQGQRRYPVLYLTDGEAHLVHTRGTVDFLVANGLMPDVVIVGITNTNRIRDLSPTHLEYFEDGDGRFPTRDSGGGDRFLELVESELAPFVEAHYRTLPFRIFCGHSAGGNLAVQALVKRPQLFNALIAASPGLAWDNQVLVRWAEPFFAGRRELKRSFFMTIGDEPNSRPAYEAMARILDGATAAGFRWSSLAMPDEDHGSVVLRSHYFGLRWLFEGYRLPADFAGGLAEVKKHYAELSARLGLDVPPPEVSVNRLGYRALATGNGAGALELFRFNVATYPDSANVYDSLADGLEPAGQLEEALANCHKAVDRGEKTSDPNLAVYRTHRDRLAAQVKPAK